MVTIEDVRAVVRQLPRAYEALVYDRVKFRVGRIVFLAFSRDEEIMGFAFPREERAALVAAEPGKFLMPGPSDLRYRWLQVRMAAIDQAEMEELVLDAWRMCVPKRVAAGFPESASPSGSRRGSSTTPSASRTGVSSATGPARTFGPGRWRQAQGLRRSSAGWPDRTSTTSISTCGRTA